RASTSTAGGAATCWAWIRRSSRAGCRQSLFTWGSRSNLAPKRAPLVARGGNMAAEGLNLATEPRENPAGAGVEWIAEGWRLFAKAPLMWIVALLVIIVLAVVVGIIPLIGTLAFQVAQPVFAAGLMVACRSLETGGEFEIEHVFAGFKQNFANLLIVG